MTISGEKEIFAIESEVETVEKGWILGHIRFWLQGDPCGNWNDFADLKDCVSWLQKFAESPANGCEQKLMTWPTAKLFKALLWSAFGPDYPGGEIGSELPIENAYSRFCISHLGMSSFDVVQIFLLENQQFQRCLWSPIGDDTVRDIRFPSGQMQRVAREFCLRFTEQYTLAMAIPKS